MIKLEYWHAHAECPFECASSDPFPVQTVLIFDLCPLTEHCAISVEGESIAVPLKEARIVDDLVVNMVDVGEETGALDNMMYKVADVYDEEVAVLVDAMIKLLEPLLVVVLGLVVGFIVIALFMPLIKLLNDLS